MTDKKTTPLVPGDQFHFLTSGLIFRSSAEAFGGEVSSRAQTVTVTATLLDLSKDRNGYSWLSLIDDEEAQTKRWGEPAIRRGPAPADMTPWQPGTEEETVAREKARAAAWELPLGEARDEAFNDILRRFGRARTSKTIHTYGFSK
jgi:hypothetical protein